MKYIPKVVLVEQDTFLRDMYSRMLSEECTVYAAASAQDCIDVLDSTMVDVVVCDMYLGFNNGIEILHELRSYQDWLDIPCIVLSIDPITSYPETVRWEQYGVVGFLYKPRLSQRQLLRTVSVAVQQRNLSGTTAQ